MMTLTIFTITALLYWFGVLTISMNRDGRPPIAYFQCRFLALALALLSLCTGHDQRMISMKDRHWKIYQKVDAFCPCIRYMAPTYSMANLMRNKLSNFREEVLLMMFTVFMAIWSRHQICRKRVQTTSNENVSLGSAFGYAYEETLQCLQPH